MSSGISRLLGSARPPHAFVVTRERLVYVRKEGKDSVAGGSSVATFARALPAGSFTEGPGGCPVATPLFGRALGTLLDEAGKHPSVASLSVPDDFVHAMALDLDDPEKNSKEAEEILGWKFAKTFGEGQALRLAWQTAGAGPAGTRVLAVAAPEEAVASWEAPFTAAGIRIGAVETASLAVSYLARKSIAGNGFLVWADGSSATTIFLKDGNIRFIRTKATGDAEEALQEIRLAASFVAADGVRAGGEMPALDIDGACAAGPPGAPIVERFRAFRAESGGRDPAPLSRAALLPEPGVAGLAKRRADEDPAVLVALGAMAGE